MSILTALIGPITGLLDKFIPDKTELAKLSHEIATMGEKAAHETVMAQIEVNKVSASSPNLFVSGGRPFIIWVCGFAFLYNVLLFPIIQFMVVMIMDNPPVLPVLPSEMLTATMGGLLGLGGMRSWEKAKGVARAS